MRHRKKGRKLQRKRDQRKALLRNLSESLILNEGIVTTEAKAKELRPFIERRITIAKKGDLSAIRQLRKDFSEKITQILVKKIAPRYKERNGGYTRITKIGVRKGDGAKMVKIELVK